ncbi:MAG TPA: phosphopantetheine-binding protein [bacterium]|nr:phosphopantetheine-binding protein [bacterium]HPQ68690.1 phosphopantetheine-binding protein [bacterium]
MDLEAKIRQIICDLLDVDEDDVTQDAFLADDLGMTPDDLEELVSILNEEFEVEIPDVDAEDWDTFSDIVSYLDDKLDHAED